MLPDGGKECSFFVARRMRNDFRVLFSTGAEMQEKRGVTAVIKNHVGVAPVRPLEDPMRIGPVFLDRFALTCKNRDAVLHNGSRCVVLRGEDVAARPTDFSAKSRQCFDENGCLNGHVQRPGDAGALQRLACGIFAPDSHEAGHFHLGNLNFLAAPVGKTKVGDNVVFSSVHLSS